MKTDYPIELLCTAFAVARSGYYRHLARQRHPGPRGQRDAVLAALIDEEFAQSRGTYGVPRIHRALHKRHEPVSRKRVARLMRAHGLRGCAPRRRHIVTTDSRHDQPIAPNRLAERAPATGPDQIWVADITYIHTDEGWLYLAGVKDAYSRRMVGWAMSDTIDTPLVSAAWRHAHQQRRPAPGLLFHSDRGVQYASAAFRAELAAAGVVQSMSRRGNCYDNAMMESGWGTLKTECVYRLHFASRQQARLALFDYLHFYNRRRCHSALGFISPVDFELQSN
jgi:transposase InsO family protein